MYFKVATAMITLVVSVETLSTNARMLYIVYSIYFALYQFHSLRRLSLYVIVLDLAVRP